MASKEAIAKIKINRLLEKAGWRLFDDENGQANIVLEPNVKITQNALNEPGTDLEKSSNDLRQQPDYADKERVNFVHANYMSEADISFCRNFDLAELAGEPNFPDMEALHAVLAEAYPDEEEEAA